MSTSLTSSTPQTAFSASAGRSPRSGRLLFNSHQLDSNADRNVICGNSSDATAEIHRSSAVLGIIAESSSHEKNSGDPDRIDESIKLRYRRLSRAAALLPDTRLAQCSWREAPQAAYVVGRYDPDRGRSYFANLIQCDKPSCPICGFRRAELVRHELSVALAQAEKLGFFPLLITGTLRHHADDVLADLKAALAKAWDKTFSGRWYDDLCAEYLIVGKTKSWENLFGKNGFHPHLHGLMFMGFELAGRSLDEFTDRVRQRWIDQLAKLDLDASWKNGLDVRTAQSDIAEYIAKFGREPLSRTWGADSEIAMSPVKKAHFEGLTPFELLDAADGDKQALERLSIAVAIDDRDQLIQRAGWLFREHYHAFERTAQIHWGKTLRPALHLDAGDWGAGALAEFDQANPVEHNDVDMVLIERGAEWKKVLKLPDGRADLRAVIRTGDAFKVLAWIGLHNIAGIVSEQALEASAAGEVVHPAKTVDRAAQPGRSDNGIALGDAISGHTAPQDSNKPRVNDQEAGKSHQSDQVEQLDQLSLPGVDDLVRRRAGPVYS